MSPASLGEDEDEVYSALDNLFVWFGGVPSVHPGTKKTGKFRDVATSYELELRSRIVCDDDLD